MTSMSATEAPSVFANDPIVTLERSIIAKPRPVTMFPSARFDAAIFGCQAAACVTALARSTQRDLFGSACVTFCRRKATGSIFAA